MTEQELAATAIFYSLSTIAQTVAGALAILAVFVVPRLDNLSRALNEHMDILWQESGYRGEKAVDDARFAGDTGALLTEIEKRTTEATDRDPEYRKRYPAVCDRLAAALEMQRNRDAVLDKVSRSVWWSVGAIAYALCGLALVPYYAAYPSWALWVPATGVLLVLIVLMSYVGLIKDSLSGRRSSRAA